jgi:hypothetical protein
MQKSEYQIISCKDSKELAKFLAKEGQFLLPMLELIEHAQTAVDEVIDVVGRSAVEAILLLSAQQVGGPQHKGKNTGDVLWYGRQRGVVPLAEKGALLSTSRQTRVNPSIPLRKSAGSTNHDIDFPRLLATPLINPKSSGQRAIVSPYVLSVCMIIADVNKKSHKRGSHAFSQPERSHKITR